MSNRSLLPQSFAQVRFVLFVDGRFPPIPNNSRASAFDPKRTFQPDESTGRRSS